MSNDWATDKAMLCLAHESQADQMTAVAAGFREVKAFHTQTTPTPRPASELKPLSPCESTIDARTVMVDDRPVAVPDGYKLAKELIRHGDLFLSLTMFRKHGCACWEPVNPEHVGKDGEPYADSMTYGMLIRLRPQPRPAVTPETIGDVCDDCGETLGRHENGKSWTCVNGDCQACGLSCVRYEADTPPRPARDWATVAKEILARIEGEINDHRNCPINTLKTQNIVTAILTAHTPDEAARVDELDAMQERCVDRGNEIKELRDRLQKIAEQHKSDEWEEEGDTEAAYDAIIDIARSALSRDVGKQCDHQWVSADNEVVTGGEICTKCHMFRAAQQEIDHAEN